MDILAPSQLGIASQIDVRSLRADSPTLIQVPYHSTATQGKISNNASVQHSTRNFSRKLHAAETASRSSSCSPSAELVNLTTGLSFIDFSTSQPLNLETRLSNLEQLEQKTAPVLYAAPPTPSRKSTVFSRPVSPDTPTKQSSVPSTPVASKPVRPTFGRSISLLDTIRPTNATFVAKESSLVESPMDKPYRPAFTRSPTSIGASHRQRSSTNTFTNTVGEKLGWLRSRAFSNVSATSTTTQRPISPAAVQQAQEDAELMAADPLVNLDISSALFPTGIVDFTDSSSFNGLLANATALIQTLQTAYKQRTLEVNKLRGQYASQGEDLEEAETRCRHLRMQLSNMSSRMTETEMSLRSQLADECQQRKALEIKEKERLARRRTNPYRTTDLASPTTSTASDGCDSGFESDAESHYSVHSSSSSSTTSAGSCTPLGVKRAQETPDLISSCTSPAPSDAVWERSGAAAPLDPVAETYMLRNRVAELESAVEACLRLI